MSTQIARSPRKLAHTNGPHRRDAQTTQLEIRLLRMVFVADISVNRNSLISALAVATRSTWSAAVCLMIAAVCLTMGVIWLSVADDLLSADALDGRRA